MTEDDVTRLMFIYEGIYRIQYGQIVVYVDDMVKIMPGRMLEDHAAKLIGNQAMDFHKQDGVTAPWTTPKPRLHGSEAINLWF